MTELNSFTGLISPVLDTTVPAVKLAAAGTPLP
jgi:hypothetical protein